MRETASAGIDFGDAGDDLIFAAEGDDVVLYADADGNTATDFSITPHGAFDLQQDALVF